MTQPAADHVRVTIDERAVEVPKGTGLVETAQAAGIEIPVFCYEPRLASPASSLRRIAVIQRVPSRHGVHLPQDSCS